MKTGRTASVEIGTCTTWLTMDTDRATRLMGVTPVKEASAVVVVRIQPQPVPEMSETTSMVASAISPAPAVCPMRRRTEASFPAQTHPRNSTPRSAGDFTPAASAHRITPGTVPKRLATASPAMSSPIINASLCAPPISDSRTRGEPAPIRTAWAGSCLSDRAKVGVAATTIAMPADLQQAQEDQVRQDLVARSLVEQAVHAQEGRTVGRLRPRPHCVGHLVERRRPEHLGPVGVRVDVVAHHLALRGVGVDVAAEERRCEEERHGPDRHDEHDALDRETVVAVQVTEEAEPHPAEEDQPAEHQRERGDGRERAVGAEGTEGPSRHAEEPCTGQVGLEGLASEHGTHHDCRASDEPEQCRARHVESRAGCPGTSVSTFWGGVAVVVALGDTSSIGDSLVEPPRCFTAGAENFMKLQ